MSFSVSFCFLFVWRDEKNELEKKAFLSPSKPPPDVSWAMEPQAMPKKLHSQPHRGQLQSLCAVSSCFQKTRAFLDVLSDLYQADASHKVPRRNRNTLMSLELVLRSEIGLEACYVSPHFPFGLRWCQNKAKGPLLGLEGKFLIHSHSEKRRVFYKCELLTRAFLWHFRFVY